MVADIGFVVEGSGEYNTYCSLVSRVAGGSTFCPIINAGGYGSVICNLEEHLLDLVRFSPVRFVIVTIDSIDPVKDQLFNHCIDLKSNLESRCIAWHQQMQQNQKLIQQLPERISVVIQHSTFESWIISDPIGLERAELVLPGVLPRPMKGLNFDDHIKNPAMVLKQALPEGFDLKKQANVKSLIAAIDPVRGAQSSRSLAKFIKEINQVFFN